MPNPTKKTPELVAEVLSRIALGETLASISRDLGFHAAVFRKWVREDEQLAIAHQQARDDGADAIAEDALAIIDAKPDAVEGRTHADRAVLDRRPRRSRFIDARYTPREEREGRPRGPASGPRWFA